MQGAPLYLAMQLCGRVGYECAQRRLHIMAGVLRLLIPRRLLVLLMLIRVPRLCLLLLRRQLLLLLQQLLLLRCKRCVRQHLGRLLLQTRVLWILALRQHGAQHVVGEGLVVGAERRHPELVRLRLGSLPLHIVARHHSMTGSEPSKRRREAC